MLSSPFLERRRTGIFTCKTEDEQEENPDQNDLYSGFCFPYASVSSFSTSYVNYENTKDFLHYLEPPECSIKAEESMASNEYSEVDTTPQTSLNPSTSTSISSIQVVENSNQEGFVVPYVNVNLEKRKLEMLESFQV